MSFDADRTGPIDACRFRLLSPAVTDPAIAHQFGEEAAREECRRAHEAFRRKEVGRETYGVLQQDVQEFRGLLKTFVVDLKRGGGRLTLYDPFE